MKRAAPALEELADTLTIDGARTGAAQSGLVSAELVGGPDWLQGFAAGYFEYLHSLPLLALERSSAGALWLGVWPVPRYVTLLRFDPPARVIRRGGTELRYPIRGGLAARGPAGYIAFGCAPAGRQARLWIEVVDFWPRLGTGPLYLLSQVVIHRLVTKRYLLLVAAGRRLPGG